MTTKFTAVSASGLQLAFVVLAAVSCGKGAVEAGSGATDAGGNVSGSDTGSSGAANVASNGGTTTANSAPPTVTQPGSNTNSPAGTTSSRGQTEGSSPPSTGSTTAGGTDRSSDGTTSPSGAGSTATGSTGGSGDTTSGVDLDAGPFPASTGQPTQGSGDSQSGTGGSSNESASLDAGPNSAMGTTETAFDSIRTAGCGLAPQPSSSSYQTVNVGGQQRRYLVSLPANYDPDVAYPLVFAFHGGGDTIEVFKGWAGVVEDETAGGAIFIYPEGPDGIWMAEVYEADFTPHDAAYEWVTQRYCVDQSAVFAWGHSWGGWAATSMACARSELLAGVASNGGGGPLQPCKVSMPILLIHGTNDPAEPISSSIQSRNLFAKNNACSDGVESFTPEPCVSLLGCDDAVVWCEHPGEHVLPDFGPEAIWNFFQSLRL